MSNVTLIYHGHSNIEIHTATPAGKFVILLDPFYTSNPLADVKAPTAAPTHILLSHAHFDHIEDAAALARKHHAVIAASYEITKWYETAGINNTQSMNHGGGFNFPFGRATMTIAFHTSTFPDGSYGGQPGGWIIETAGKTIYFAGDTALFGDMALLGKLWSIDLACLPIGDTFTMGPAHALLAAEMLKPKSVLPIHYNTFPPIKQDPAAFAETLRRKTGIAAAVLKPGGTFEL